MIDFLFYLLVWIILGACGVAMIEHELEETGCDPMTKTAFLMGIALGPLTFLLGVLAFVMGGW